MVQKWQNHTETTVLNKDPSVLVLIRVLETVQVQRASRSLENRDGRRRQPGKGRRVIMKGEHNREDNGEKKRRELEKRNEARLSMVMAFQVRCNRNIRNGNAQEVNTPSLVEAEFGGMRSLGLALMMRVLLK